MKRNKRTAGRGLSGRIKLDAPAPRNWRRHVLLFGVIALALLTYSNSFHAPFLLDNNEVILQDTRVHAATAENFDRILGSPYYQSILAGLYRPLTTLSFLYNYAVLGNGPNPEGYHWLNFLLHALNISLVYALGVVLFEETPAALALSALWGVHPVLTEAVTNIVGRADMLAAFGVLAAVLCYRRSLRSAGAARGLWICGIATATTAGLFSKESAIAALAAVALYDWMFEMSSDSRSRIAGYAAVAVPAAIFFAVRARVLAHFPAGPFPFTDNPLSGAGFWTARLTAFKVIGKYLGLLVWPARLAPDYSYNEIPVAADARGVMWLAFCLIAVAAAIWSWRRARAPSFAILFFFAMLAPVSNVVLRIGSIMGERFLYLPSVGFAIVVVYGMRAIWRSGRIYRYVAYGTLAAVLAAFGVRAYARNRDWLDERRFWASAVAATPNNYKALISDAATTPLANRADRDRAGDEAQRAIAMLNSLPPARNSGYAYRQAAVLYRDIGDRYTAKQAADGADPQDYYRESWALLTWAEAIERALDEVYRAENQRRGTPQATFLPSVVFLEQGRTYLRMLKHPEAIEAFERGRSLESDPVLLEELGRTYEAVEQPRKAAQALVEALLMDSRRSHINQKLVELYGKVDPQGCAANHEGGAPSLNIACPMVHDDICGASRNVAQNYVRRNQMQEAESIRRVAVTDLACTAESVN